MLSACFHGHCCGLTRVRYSGGIPRVDLHLGWLSSLLFQGRSRLWSERKGKIEAVLHTPGRLARAFVRGAGYTFVEMSLAVWWLSTLWQLCALTSPAWHTLSHI